jgi:hypothetical protein
LIDEDITDEEPGIRRAYMGKAAIEEDLIWESKTTKGIMV